MRLLLLLGSYVLVLWGCAPSQRLLPTDDRSPAAVEARASKSLLVRAQEESSQGKWAAFFPSDMEKAGLTGWSAKALLEAGYLVDVIELEDEEEQTVGPGLFRGSEDGTDELRIRRPPRRGGPGQPRRQPPLLTPRPTPEERLEIQRRAADLQAVQLSRKLYHQRLAEAQARYPKNGGYQEHHFVPLYLGGDHSGVSPTLGLWEEGQARS
jgi:hypothetical protein